MSRESKASDDGRASTKPQWKNVGIRLELPDYRLVQVMAVRDEMSVAKFCEELIHEGILRRRGEIREAAEEFMSQVIADLEETETVKT